MFEIREFTKAVAIVAQVMKAGAAAHPSNDWANWPAEYHVARATEHLRLLAEGDQREDHLSHAATRLLMALTLRAVF